jgi:hypothetical protein
LFICLDCLSESTNGRFCCKSKVGIFARHRCSADKDYTTEGRFVLWDDAKRLFLVSPEDAEYVESGRWRRIQKGDTLQETERLDGLYSERTERMLQRMVKRDEEAEIPDGVIHLSLASMFATLGI